MLGIYKLVRAVPNTRNVDKMMTNLIPFPAPDAKAHADAETELKKRLFAWADGVLQQLGLAAKVAQAMDFDDLRKITLDVEDVDVALAIRNALHPAGGQRADHFVGLTAGALKRLLKVRFAEMKKSREAKLLRGQGGQGQQSSTAYNWTNDIKFDAKGGVRPILANLSCFCANTRPGRMCWPSINSMRESSSGNARIGATKKLTRLGPIITSSWFEFGFRTRTSPQIKVTSAGRCKRPRGII